MYHVNLNVAKKPSETINSSFFQESVNQTDNLEIFSFFQRLDNTMLTSQRTLVKELKPVDVQYLALIAQKRILPLAFRYEFAADNLLWLASNISSLSNDLLVEAQESHLATKK